MNTPPAGRSSLRGDLRAGLVEWHLRVASGRSCRRSMTSFDPRGGDRGAALCGVREGLLPSFGRRPFRSRDECRLETRRGGRCPSPFYDPRSQVVAREGSRGSIGRSVGDLDEVRGLRSHHAVFLSTLCFSRVRAADIDTGYRRHLDELVPDAEPAMPIWRGSAAVALASAMNENRSSI